MKREKWLKWEPIEGIPQTIYLRGLKYDYDGLTINIQDKDEKYLILTIHFEGFFAIRIVDEGDLLKGSHDMDKAVIEMEKEKGSYYKWSLFTVENSLYLEWFHEQSLGVRKKEELVHYIIRTSEDVIEVLDIAEPTVMWS